jgi:hypothetical protein
MSAMGHSATKRCKVLMSEKCSEPDIKQCRFNLSEVPGQSLHTMHLVLCSEHRLRQSPR